MSDYFTEYDEILENELGISDPELLKQAETDIVFVRLTELMQMPVQGAFDFNHLKAIHKHLFSDIYQMAGKVRTVNLAKGNSVFCYAENIETMQQGIFSQLKNDHYFADLDIDSFSQKLADISGDLNALHPFREGNGRAIRCFLIQLADHAGYDLQFERTDRVTLLNANISAFNGDTASLASLYEKLIAQK